MDIKIKVSVCTTKELEEYIKEIKEIEKEYNCECTLVDITISH